MPGGEVVTSEVPGRLRLLVEAAPDDAAAVARRQRSWAQLLEDWRGVLADVQAFMGGLEPKDWDAPTMCDRWTQKDLVAHHIKGDALTLQAFSGGDGFAFRTMDDERQRERADDYIAEFRETPYPELVERWRAGADALLTRCEELEPAQVHEQVPWAAVPISRIALLQARISETWIHGWDSRWPLGAPTTFDDRCYWITDLAVRTTVPYGVQKAVEAGAEPVVGPVTFDLTGAGGGTWERRAQGDDPVAHAVAGPAWAWVGLATRRWTEHLGWRKSEGVGLDDLGSLVSIEGPRRRALLQAARAFV